ncbi:unnamed protein product [Urochloa humidicola]
MWGLLSSSTFLPLIPFTAQSTHHTPQHACGGTVEAGRQARSLPDGDGEDGRRAGEGACASGRRPALARCTHGRAANGPRRRRCGGVGPQEPSRAARRRCFGRWRSTGGAQPQAPLRIRINLNLAFATTESSPRMRNQTS